jgi:glycosyltransferase involved in cell wall biosynthesis
MKVAIVHDYLTQNGGAERVLERFLELFPKADLYTLMYEPSPALERFRARIRGTSFLDHPLVRRDHRWFIPLMPVAARTLRLKDDYDLVISASAGFAKGVRFDRSPLHSRPFHLSYCYTPLRYAWEVDSYFTSTVFKTVFRPILTHLKAWDYRAAQRPDALVAISSFIASKIEAYYDRRAPIVYSPVDYETFYYDPLLPQATDTSYYLTAGRLLHYKRFDLVIKAFRMLGLPLKVVGTGRDRRALEGFAGRAPNIEFLSFVSDDELRALYHGARAFIFPQVEDFGLVAAEAQACGTPVIAFRGGGSLEIIRDGTTGVFFDSQTVDALARAVAQSQEVRFNRARIARESRRFSASLFREGILSHLPTPLKDAALEDLSHARTLPAFSPRIRPKLLQA